MPFIALDSPDPTELWKWMDSQRKAGNELLAISHNANVSDGWMYPIDVDNTIGRPIDAAYAAARDRNERLVEIKQGKGAVGDASVAVADRRVRQLRDVQGHARAPGRRRAALLTSPAAMPARRLKDGITMQDVRGFNPYKFGMAGGSDSHNTGSPYRQDNFYGAPRRRGRHAREAFGRCAASAAPWTCAWRIPAG